MSSCPNCHQTIQILDQHKGALFNCPFCRAVFFVDWDGNPEGLATHEAEPIAPGESFIEDASSIPAIEENFVSENPIITPETPSDAGFEMIAAEPQEAFQAFEQSLPSMPEIPDPPVNPGSSGNSFADEMADVVAFGNQELAVGPLTYTLFIQGLEIADTFEKLREALTDSRFGWDADQLMSQVQSGRLELKGMNPTKASILINRIKYLPIELSWKQEVFGGTA